MATGKSNIVIARGDGIGPEIMDATLNILKAANCDLNIHEIEVGEKVYLRGVPTGIEPESWNQILKADAFLKAPITTPQGGGFRSLNVTIRAALGLYANVRPCVAYYPFVETKFPGMDVVIIRENEEDLYAGIEYRKSQGTVHALKVITREGSERIIRYAFEYAKRNKRKKVTCFTKDNILKMSDGLFHKIFDEVSKEYPELEKEHWIVDIGAAKLAASPENFDVVVLPNLYGDILSDVSAQIAGSVGLAGSANIGEKGAMFEAIHGSAPRRAGQNLANPSGLILASCMMLEHIGDAKNSERIHNAWLKTIEDGIHTYDIFNDNFSHKKVGTKEFAQEVIERLGKIPQKLKPVHVGKATKSAHGKIQPKKDELKRLVGVDLYIESKELPEVIKTKVEKATQNFTKLALKMISNRGLVVFPSHVKDLSMSDLFRLRFQGDNVKPQDIVELQRELLSSGFDVTSSENLYFFGSDPGFSTSSNE